MSIALITRGMISGGGETIIKNLGSLGEIDIDIMLDEYNIDIYYDN
jgi:hypothetical protein